MSARQANWETLEPWPASNGLSYAVKKQGLTQCAAIDDDKPVDWMNPTWRDQKRAYWYMMFENFIV